MAAKPKSCSSAGVSRLKPFSKDGKTINAVIETPKGRRNKFKYDEATDCFRLNGVLPAGATFPYDFGFLPGSTAPDGDPLDVLLLMDESAFPGCFVPARLIGVIEAEQTEDGTTTRNDRLIAVAEDAHDYRDIQRLKDINQNLLKELEHFFVSYNAMRGKKFKVIGCRGPNTALRLAKAAVQKCRRRQS